MSSDNDWQLVDTVIIGSCAFFRRCVSDPMYEEVNNAFERALVFMHKVSMVLGGTHANFVYVDSGKIYGVFLLSYLSFPVL